MRTDDTSVLLRMQIPRWIVSSINKYVNSVITRFNPGNIAFLQTAEFSPDVVRNKQRLIVIEFEGPVPRRLSASTERYTVDYTLIVTTHRIQNDIYAHQRTYGIAAQAFPPCIPVYRYGEGSLDNGTQLGELQQVDDPTTFVHGVPDANTAIYQSSISAQYRMDYVEE